jgi:hypothetical protein
MWEGSLTITTEKERKSEEKWLTSFSWMWNPSKNTYPRIIFWILTNRVLEFIFYGSISMMSSAFFLFCRVMISISGRGWHLVFVSSYLIIVFFTFTVNGFVIGIADLLADYIINWIYFQHMGNDPEEKKKGE